MRKLILAPAMALAVLLASCSTVRDPTAPPVTTGTAVQFVQAVKQWAITVCGFEPTLNVGTAVVAQLMSVYWPASVPLQQAAHAVASAICSSPDAPATARTAGPRKIVNTPRGTIIVPGRYRGR
jgi:hypothetical protein